MTCGALFAWWSIVLSHPKGSTLVHGTAGIVEGKLKGETVDIVMLGIAGLSRLGKEYTQNLWQETILTTGATRVIAIHHDDFLASFGEVRLLPDVLDQVLKTVAWINDLAALSNNRIDLELPPFGEPILLY